MIGLIRESDPQNGRNIQVKDLFHKLPRCLFLSYHLFYFNFLKSPKSDEQKNTNKTVVQQEPGCFGLYRGLIYCIFVGPGV